MSLDTVEEFRHDFVAFAFGSILRRVGWTPKLLAKVCADCLKHLLKQVPRMPEELVLVLKALAESADAAQVASVQPQIFFLRFICPGLVQPTTLGGLETVPDDMARSLLALAKALQLIANRVDPGPDTFAAPVQAELRKQHDQVARIFAAVNALPRGRPSPPVEKSLSEPARYVCQLVDNLPMMEDERAAMALHCLKLKLAEPAAAPQVKQPDAASGAATSWLKASKTSITSLPSM
jgi:hypothetical protein